ncbi:MAG TPA: FAD-dependent oxidoreductase, partial [Deltaproteobacteria bacterium]|nr:FAD-dependent oxidoreductase [Deltaproteobacteria bacterium]
MADIVIIGAGPAGVFAALELVSDTQGLDVVMVEQGKDIPSRSRSTGDIMQGWGGAGAFSDGKLTLSTELGGDLSSLVPEKELMGLVEEVDTTYLRYSAPNKVFEVSPDNAEKISARAKLAGLMYIPTRIRHIGTENCYAVLKNMRDYLDDKLEIIFNTKVMEIVSHEGRVNGVRLEDGRLIEARYVIVAPGRAGSAWMASQAASLGIDAWPNPVDLGVRVELPAVTMEELTSMAYETKFIYYSRTFDDRVRTFCMNPY